MNLPKTGRFVCLLIFGLCVLPGGVFADGGAYEPLKILQKNKPEILSLIVNDAARQRSIPVRLYLPPDATPAPIVLFSHGLGGSGIEYAYLGEHWALRGYAAVFIQHPGSDTSVWQGKPPGQRMAAMQEAASLSNFILRVKDVPAVLDELQLLNKTGGHALFGRLDPDRVGMSGHSFGAITTQAVGGQTYVQGISFTDPRIKAALAMSPTTPPNQDPKQAFASVKIPWMVMTGTADVSFIGTADTNNRLAVFPALPPGGKYELVLSDAEHSAFTDRALPGDSKKRNPNHHRAILALSTAFWDAWLAGDGSAREWLAGDGPRSVLEKADRWQRK